MASLTKTFLQALLDELVEAGWELASSLGDLKMMTEDHVRLILDTSQMVAEELTERTSVFSSASVKESKASNSKTFDVVTLPQLRFQSFFFF